MKEKHVLSSVIRERKAYDAVTNHVERDDFSEQGWIIWGAIKEYYAKDSDAKSIQADLLGEAVARKVSADKHKHMFRTLVASVAEFESSPANVVDDLLATKRDALGNRLANALLTGAYDVPSLIQAYQALEGGLEETATEGETRSGLSVAELVRERFSADNLIQIYPEALNKRLDGGAKPGHHLIVFGRPEIGKTMLTIEMMAGFLQQRLPVLYCGNEDPIDDINMRVVNRLALMPKYDVMNYPDKADAKARERGYELLTMASLAPGTPREITSLVEAHRPSVLIIDQLRNLKMGNDNYVLRLEEAATQAREWAKRYKMVVVSVTQAGDSASGKAGLDLGDVDYSNTGIPAQADVMVGVGATDKNMQRGELVLSLPKNKISGTHEWFTVLAQPQLSRLEGIE